jgi:hypothetical protein
MRSYLPEPERWHLEYKYCVEMDMPMTYGAVRLFMRVEMTGDWPDAESVKGSIMSAPDRAIDHLDKHYDEAKAVGVDPDGLIAGYRKLKRLAAVDVLPLDKYRHWERLRPYFEDLGLKGIEDLPLVMIDDEQYWLAFYGSNLSQSDAESKAIVLRKGIFDALDLNDNLLSMFVHEVGHLIFYARLEEKRESYLDSFRRGQKYTSTAMESVAFQTQMDFLKYRGQSEHDVLQFMTEYLGRNYGDKDALDAERRQRRDEEQNDLERYVRSVFKGY